MREAFKATKISDHVYWVGAVDWDARDLHGYLTQRGTTYNAYLVLSDKITLIDTVKGHLKEEMLARIASVVDPEDISYIISNHSEMDHSGCLPQAIEAVKPEKVLASRVGVKTLSSEFHNMDTEIIPVKDGETLIARSCAGGGYGPPWERDPEAVRKHVEEGWVSPERARTIYGVVFDSSGAVELEETRAARALLARTT